MGRFSAIAIRPGESNDSRGLTRPSDDPSMICVQWHDCAIAS